MLINCFYSGRASRVGQKWYTRDESIQSNLKQYGLGDRYVDVMVADSSTHQTLWAHQQMFDAIITDREYLLSTTTFLII